MPIRFCTDHSLVRTDSIMWRKSKNLQRLLLRIGKPAFIEKCPDCIMQETIREQFLKKKL